MKIRELGRNLGGNPSRNTLLSKILLVCLGAFAAQQSGAALFYGQYGFVGGSSSANMHINGPVVFSQISDSDGAGGVSINFASDMMNVTGWPASFDEGKYVSFTVSADSGYYLSALNTTFVVDSSAGSPTSLTVRTYSGASYSENTLNLDSTPGPQFLTFSPSTAAWAGQVNMRIYYTGSSTLAFDSIDLTGDVSPVPEPVNIALIGFGACALCGGLGRKLYRRMA